MATKIEDNFDNLRKEWFESDNGLYIDSYKKFDSIFGYKINLRNKEDIE